MGQFGIVDVTKFFAPIYCGYYVAWRAVRYFGPYHPIGSNPRPVMNASGHQPIFYASLGFVGTCVLMFIAWKCFFWFLDYLDGKRRRSEASARGED